MDQFGSGNINVGDTVRLDGETEWAQVVDKSATACDVLYDNGNVYEIDYDLIVEHRAGVVPAKTPEPEEAPKDANGIPFPDGNVPSTQPVAAMSQRPPVDPRLVEHQKDLKVKPGVIVTYKHSAKKKLPANRLWVVLAFTKGSNQQDVNICPVNGDPRYKYEYVRVKVADCTPVKFASLVKGGK